MYETSVTFLSELFFLFYKLAAFLRKKQKDNFPTVKWKKNVALPGIEPVTSPFKGHRSTNVLLAIVNCIEDLSKVSRI
jgi:hypothetical protein